MILQLCQLFFKKSTLEPKVLANCDQYTTSQFSEVLDRAVANQFFYILWENILLEDVQLGFRVHHIIEWQYS